MYMGTLGPQIDDLVCVCVGGGGGGGGGQTGTAPLYVVPHTQFIDFNLAQSHLGSNVLYTNYDDIMTNTFECIMHLSHIVHKSTASYCTV